MPFGKYYGKSIAWVVDNDKEYALWLLNNVKGRFAFVKTWIRAYMDGSGGIDERIWQDALELSYRIQEAIAISDFYMKE